MDEVYLITLCLSFLPPHGSQGVLLVVLGPGHPTSHRGWCCDLGSFCQLSGFGWRSVGGAVREHRSYFILCLHFDKVQGTSF